MAPPTRHDRIVTAFGFRMWARKLRLAIADLYRHARRCQGERVPAAMQDRHGEITALTDAFCTEHLTDEYRDLCRRLIATLCRTSDHRHLRPVLHALGLVAWPTRSGGSTSFSTDPRSHTCARMRCASEHFELSTQTGSARSGAILNLLKVGQLDPGWSLSSQLARNPLARLTSRSMVLLLTHVALHDICRKRPSAKASSHSCQTKIASPEAVPVPHVRCAQLPSIPSL